MKRILYLFLFVVFIDSCDITQMVYNSDISYMYRYDSTFLHPEIQVYHSSDQLSDVYYAVDSKELLFSGEPSNGKDLTSQFIIVFQVTPTLGSRVILDSGSVTVNNVENHIPRLIRGKFSIKDSAGTNNLLKLTFLDVNRKQKFDKYINLYKGSTAGSQNFFVSEEPGFPLFRNTVSANEKVNITYKKSNKRRLYGRYFKQNFPPAKAPFSIVEIKPVSFKPDSFFVLQLNDSGTVTFQAPKIGIYNFSIDSTQLEGLTLYRYYEGFPGIVKAEQMVSPLRYITSTEEYDAITGNKSKKLAVENFLLNCAGNKDKAREMIKVYYSRVRYSNIYFSSYLEGWKSDRGMIYMIFGPPGQVYKTTDSETWVYGLESDASSMTFNFNRLINPLSDNDYCLQRSSVYKTNWFNEVDDVWRQGRIYTQN